MDFSIRTDFRAIIDILVAMNDPELDEQAKAVVMLQILFEDWQSIPPEQSCLHPVPSPSNGVLGGSDYRPTVRSR